MGAVGDNHCEYCKDAEHAIEHILWHCPELSDVRKQASPALHGIDPDTIPVMLKRGIAPAMHASPDEAMWGGWVQGEQEQMRTVLRGDTEKNKLGNGAELTLDGHAVKGICVLGTPLPTYKVRTKKKQTPDSLKDVQGQVSRDPDIYSDGSSHPTRGSSKMWKDMTISKGAIGNLITSIYSIGGMISEDLKIHVARKQPIPLLEAPVQAVKPLVAAAAAGATKASDDTRQANTGLKEMDIKATTAYHRECDDEDRADLRMIQSGGAWDKSK